MTKTCGECRHFREADFKDMCLWKDQHRKACADFKLPTNGDKIQQGGNRALVEFVAKCLGYRCQCCAFKGIFGDCEKPIDKTCTDGVYAWLNAPADCVKQNGDHDTQTDLCKADNTESEETE